MKEIIHSNLPAHKFSIQVLMLMFVFGFWGVQAAYSQLNITPTTWNMIGLDSNNVNVGPNSFLVGARVCNTSGSAVNNVTARFIWDSSNSFINLGAADTQTYSSLAAGACIDFYFDVVVTRTPSAYNTARRYRITASGTGTSTVSTPSPREIYVERFVSQSRNTIQSITGPSTVYVGQTYTFTLNASTAPGGYEQLSASINFPSSIFRILAVSTTYTSPAGATNDKFYADACGWNNNPTSSTYRSCIGPPNYAGGKAGGTIKTTYTVQVIANGNAAITALIYDFSGASYHYNSDNGSFNLSINALPVPKIDLNKSVSPIGVQLPGTELTYKIDFINSGTTFARNFILIDPNPAGTLRINTNTDFKIGSVVNLLGSTGLAASVSYSNNGGASFTYIPVSGGGGAPSGYDRNVTHIRWAFTGNLSQTAPSNTGSISFTVRIR